MATFESAKRASYYPTLMNSARHFSHVSLSYFSSEWFFVVSVVHNKGRGEYLASWLDRQSADMLIRHLCPNFRVNGNETGLERSLEMFKK